METKKKKKPIVKIIIMLVLIAIIIYTFAGSAEEILDQLRQTSLKILVAIAVSSMIYHLFEGWITTSLAKRYNPDFRYYQGLQCAFYCSFYRLSTLGTGSGVAAVVFLGRHKVEYSEATGLYLIQYMIHKIGIAVFSTIFFFANYQRMMEYYSDYAIYLVLAYVLTVLISAGLILFGVSTQFHRLIFFLAGKINRKGKLDGPLAKLREMATTMERSSKELVTDVKTLVVMMLKTLCKLAFWYCIPFLILYGSSEVSLLDSLSVTSLGVLTAAVIPAPAGIGSSELILGLLYSVLVGTGRGAAIALLYRVATFIFPFLVGGITILCARFVAKSKSPASE